jgi:hypothetical protein
MSEVSRDVLNPEVSLIRGGPFYQAQLMARLIGPRQWNLGRRILFAVAIGWLPLVLIVALLQPGALVALLTDYKVASRMLIAAPILLLGQVLMESKFRMIVSQVREDLIAPAEMSRFQEAIAWVARLRDSLLPELAIVALVGLQIASSFSAKVGMAGAWAVEGAQIASDAHPSPAGWYYALVSASIYLFLVGLSLWKWLLGTCFLWTCFLFKLSRMKLQLMVSHPDKHAGIGFLGMSTVAFAPIAFAIAAAVGVTWRYEILYTDASLLSFKMPAILLLVLVLLLAVGPLLFFVPKLAPLRRKGILQYGSLAHLHSMEFYDKWILHRRGREPELLAAPEISSLTDLASSFQNIEAMKPLPFDKGSLVAPAAAVLIGLFPAILAQVPLKVIFKSLLHAMK